MLSRRSINEICRFFNYFQPGGSGLAAALWFLWTMGRPRVFHAHGKPNGFVFSNFHAGQTGRHPRERKKQ